MGFLNSEVIWLVIIHDFEAIWESFPWKWPIFWQKENLFAFLKCNFMWTFGQSRHFSQHISISFQLAGIITCPNSLVGRALEYKSRGRGLDPRLGHSSFYFCKKDFTLALVLKLPGEMPIQSQRTLFFQCNSRSFQIPCQKSKDIFPSFEKWKHQNRHW